jgi:hypothetical protein
MSADITDVPAVLWNLGDVPKNEPQWLLASPRHVRMLAIEQACGRQRNPRPIAGRPNPHLMARAPLMKFTTISDRHTNVTPTSAWRQF